MSVSFDRAAGYYDATRAIPPEALEQVARTLVEIVRPDPETSFLEVGIGTGRIALPLIERGYRYTGVDISEPMMDELRRKLRDVPNRLTLLKADATALPFEDASFDAALTVHVLHLISRWEDALTEIRRVLKPDGVFLYCNEVGDKHPAQEDFEKQWQEILARYGVKLELRGAWDEPVKRLLESSGCELETVLGAEWRAETTVRDRFDRYARRVHAMHWQIPDEVFPRALVELKEWRDRHYESVDVALSSPVRFEITVARHCPSV